jgi:hypothetical protein
MIHLFGLPDDIWHVMYRNSMTSGKLFILYYMKYKPIVLTEYEQNDVIRYFKEQDLCTNTISKLFTLETNVQKLKYLGVSEDNITKYINEYNFNLNIAKRLLSTDIKSFSDIHTQITIIEQTKSFLKYIHSLLLKVDKLKIDGYSKYGKHYNVFQTLSYKNHKYYSGFNVLGTSHKYILTTICKNMYNNLIYANHVIKYINTDLTTHILVALFYAYPYIVYKYNLFEGFELSIVMELLKNNIQYTDDNIQMPELTNDPVKLWLYYKVNPVNILKIYPKLKSFNIPFSSYSSETFNPSINISMRKCKEILQLFKFDYNVCALWVHKFNDISCIPTQYMDCRIIILYLLQNYKNAKINCNDIELSILAHVDVLNYIYSIFGNHAGTIESSIHCNCNIRPKDCMIYTHNFKNDDYYVDILNKIILDICKLNKPISPEVSRYLDSEYCNNFSIYNILCREYDFGFQKLDIFSHDILILRCTLNFEMSTLYWFCKYLNDMDLQYLIEYFESSLKYFKRDDNRYIYIVENSITLKNEINIRMHGKPLWASKQLKIQKYVDNIKKEYFVAGIDDLNIYEDLDINVYKFTSNIQINSKLVIPIKLELLRSESMQKILKFCVHNICITLI